MNLLVSKPYIVLWITVSVILLLSLIKVEETVDIQYHDTYFVFDILQLGILYSVFLCIQGLFYWLARNRKLVRWMTGFHVISTILTLLIATFYNLLFIEILSLDYFKYGRLIGIVMITVVLLFIMAQVVFVLNIMIGIIRRKNNL